MCPHTIRVSILLCKCPHTTVCVRILLYVSAYYCMCPHATVYVSAYLLYICPHAALYVSSYCSICVHIMLYMCPHTTVYVSAYCYMCRHTTVYVSSYYYTCVRILLYMCPHSTVCVRILLYMCPHTALYVSSRAPHTRTPSLSSSSFSICTFVLVKQANRVPAKYVSSGALHMLRPHHGVRRVSNAVRNLILIQYLIYC
jgi:hypothetical protein